MLIHFTVKHTVNKQVLKVVKIWKNKLVHLLCGELGEKILHDILSKLTVDRATVSLVCRVPF